MSLIATFKSAAVPPINPSSDEDQSIVTTN